MNFNERVEYNNRKLAHYNAWLLDPKREFGTVYPGFPEEADSPYRSKAKAQATQVIAKAKSAAKAATPKVKRAPRGEGPTKQELANAIYNRLAGDKALVIAAIQAELGMTPAGATTYYYNAKKAA